MESYLSTIFEKDK